MIVIDGSPGAGKTTLLGRMLEALPDRLVIFPEAQPFRSVSDDAAAARGLLAEDLARTAAADRLATARPDLIVASDRCHLGVLAYRHALRRTGRVPHRDLDHAIDLCRSHMLEDAHRGDAILVLLIEPHESTRRRAPFAHDGRYRIWYDLDFLEAYNQAMAELAQTFTSGATVVVLDVTHGPPPPPVLTAVLPPNLADLVAAAPDPGPPLATVTCRSGCAEPRSHAVISGAGSAQLFASSVHVQHPGRVACLRSASDIEAGFIARPGGPLRPMTPHDLVPQQRDAPGPHL